MEQLSNEGTRSAIYGVRKGRHANNCIFFSWDDAKVHVFNYPDAEYQGFDINGLQDAADYVNESNNDNDKEISEQSASISTSTATATATATTTNRKRRRQELNAAAGSSNSKNPPKPWIAMFDHLKQFRVQHGSFHVCSTDAEQKPLRRWIAEQRLQYKKYKLGNSKSFMTETKLKMLTDIGYDLESNPRSNLAESEKQGKKWDEMFASLQQYKETNGTVDIIRSVTKESSGDEQTLYNWIAIQRLEYRKLAKSQTSRLTASRIQKLNDAGFSFAKRPAYLKWQDRMDQLHEYKAKHGNLQIPVTDPELGEFVARQRVEHTKYLEGNKCVGMNAARERELSALGFVFCVGKRVPMERGVEDKKTWDERFQDLVSYKAEFLDTLVPQQSGLGEWVHKVRLG